MSKARHRGDILEFTIKNNNHLSVSGATFNLYVRGEDWINENEPNIWMRNGHLNNARSNVGGIHIDENAMSTSTVSTGALDDHNLATSSETIHKIHGNGKNVNNNHISISINRFVHRHQQQVSACIHSFSSTIMFIVLFFCLVSFLRPYEGIFFSSCVSKRFVGSLVDKPTHQHSRIV